MFTQILMRVFQLNNSDSICYTQQYFDSEAITILYAHGLMSDMSGVKARAIEEYAISRKINYVAFDNLGHGMSSGEYNECNISTWLNTLVEIIKGLKLSNCILVGSSMGGWISLLASQLNIPQISALILIAPAPDFTQKIWNALSEKQREAMQKGHILNINESLPITYQLLEDGKKHIILSRDKIEINVPVIIIHGMKDDQVEYDVSLKLNALIESPFLCTKIVKNSTHRMGSPEDIKLLINSIDEIQEVMLRR